MSGIFDEVGLRSSVLGGDVLNERPISTFVADNPNIPEILSFQLHEMSQRNNSKSEFIRLDVEEKNDSSFELNKAHFASQLTPVASLLADTRKKVEGLQGTLAATSQVLAKNFAKNIDLNHLRNVQQRLLKEQTAEYENPNSIFHYVVQADLGGLKLRLEKEKYSNVGESNHPMSFDKILVNKRNAMGANVIHAAYLYRNFEMGRWLVENYPEEAVQPYSNDCSNHEIDVQPDEMPYTGENILHIIIVHKSLPEARWLLDFFETHRDSVPGGLEKLLRANAVGTFFSRDSEFYCGSYPLHFAAGANSPELFNLVLAYTATMSTQGQETGRGLPIRTTMKIHNKPKAVKNDKSSRVTSTMTKKAHRDIINLGVNAIFMRDRYGNNCLHICVIHRLITMYEHIKQTATRILSREIKEAYGNYLISKDKGPGRLSLRSLPSWTPLAMETDGLPDWEGSKINNWFESALIITSRYIPWDLTPVMRRRFEQRLLGGEEIISDGGFFYGYAPRESEILPPDAQGAENANPKVVELWLKEVTLAKVKERFEWVLNEDFHSPLTLTSAGIQGISFKGTEEEEALERDTIEAIIEQDKQPRWQYGPIKASLLSLEGIELPYNFNNYGGSASSKPLPQYARDEMHGVVEWICVTDSDQSATIPAVEKIIRTKWNEFGLPLFRTLCVVRIVITILITIIVAYNSSSPTVQPNIGPEYAVTFLYPIVLFLLSILFIAEIPSILTYGLEYWGLKGHRIRGAACLDKILATAIFVTFLTLCVNKLKLYYDGQSNLYTDQIFNATNPGQVLAIVEPSSELYYHGKICEALVSLFSWLHLFYFLMGLDVSGAFVLTISRIVGRDIPYFLMFFLIVLIGFACALTTLTDDADSSGNDGWWNLFKGVTDLIQVTASMGFPPDTRLNINFVPLNLQDLFNFTIILYYVVAQLMFLNLLIGMISNTFAALTSCNESLLLMEKYNIMCGLELTTWFWVQAGSTVSRYAVKVENMENTERSTYAFQYFDENKDWWKEGTGDNYAGDGTKSSVTLLIVDPQNDFHESWGEIGDPDYCPNGSLAVPGSREDSNRIRDLVLKNIDQIDNIIVTLDSHYTIHIAHSLFWVKGGTRGKIHPPHPAPFTVISSEDIAMKLWEPADPSYDKWALYYSLELEKKGRFKLTIWPDHCIIGTAGHSVYPPLNEALQKWATRRAKSITYVLKGQNLRTEMYSAVAADVEDPTDPATALNQPLLSKLQTADQLYICGQARSHVVKFTMLDLIRYWDGDLGRLTLLEDGCSSVAGFEHVGLEFLKECRSAGVNIVNCGDVEL